MENKIKTRSQKIPKAPPLKFSRGPTEQVIKVSEKIYKIIIYLLVFLVPIFFSPLTVDPLDFQKQFLFFILIFLALLFWSIKVFLSGRVEINFNFLNIPVLIFLLIYGLSTIFSSFPYGSFWGWPLNISQGFLTLLYFTLFYFLVANIFKREEIFNLFFLFLISGFLITLFSIFQIFGKFILPWNFTKTPSFNTFGSLNSLSIFLAVLLPSTIILALISKRIFRYFLAIFTIFFLISLIFINFPSAWLILIVSTSIVFIFGLLNPQRINLVFPSAILLIIALTFLIFRISLPGIQIPIEVLPNQLTEFQIAKNSLKNFKNFFLGSGPSTFVFNYSKFKPLEINRTVFWNIRFNSGASETLDKLVTTGIFGILSLFFIFWVFFRFGWKNLQKGNFLSLAIFSSFISLFFSQFLYPANLSLLFLFWLILAFLSSLNFKIKSLVFNRFLIPVISLVLVFIFGTSLSLLLIRNYLAEVRYFSGLRYWQRGEGDRAIISLERAINFNPSLDSYFRDISQLYLAKLNGVLREAQTSKEELTNQIYFLTDKIINSAKKATEISKENVANWNVRGFIYRNLIGLVGGAENWALDSYQKAVELEPKNPYIFTEIGLVYLAKVGLLSRTGGQEKEISENLEKARENFQKAIELKSDYPPANFQLAMIYQTEGKTKEAIKKLEETKSIAPFDPGLAFQLGLLYYNDNQIDKAKAEFERAVRIDENYSNARYFLGLIYDKEGERDLAIEQFEKIEKLNPENQEVKKILANLREGKAALEGISIGQPPIEERPPERRP